MTDTANSWFRLTDATTPAQRGHAFDYARARLLHRRELPGQGALHDAVQAFAGRTDHLKRAKSARMMGRAVDLLLKASRLAGEAELLEAAP